ncbi:head completion/stabilization protein [Microbulbifer thermotolerans]|uniref:head completion/stabilization protein n=1 Tax=Microbulbifer thermotolerans TaxID=252514 RepID=UPI00224B8242|nr:head completion/stabilization protein [Microbulbifer thermotolerans]MCX2834464.1 head completion/stabilization protein [Microbulbifer thermotolerans]
MSFTGKTDSYLNSTLENNGFFPDLSLGDLQRLYRIPAEYSKEKVEHHLRLAMLDTNDDLAERQAAWQAEGHNTLAEVSDERLGGKPVLVEHYQRAVFCRATANLFGEFATVTRREIGENQAKEGEGIAKMYRAQADRALRYLLGRKTTITAELI